MRFSLIDQVIECDSTRLVAVKCVTRAEEYLGDHFPGFPVLPGVMMLEALVQAGRLFVLSREADQSPGEALQPQAAMTASDPLVLAEVRNVRYGNMVRPGQRLRVEVTLRRAPEPADDTPTWDFSGVGLVDGAADQAAVNGRFKLTPAKPRVAAALALNSV